MAGYLQRLARQSGLLPSAQSSARAPAPDLVEVHEERLAGAGEAPPATASAAAPRAEAPSILTTEAPEPLRVFSTSRVPAAGASIAARTTLAAATTRKDAASDDPVSERSVFADVPSVTAVPAGQAEAYAGAQARRIVAAGTPSSQRPQQLGLDRGHDIDRDMDPARAGSARTTPPFARNEASAPAAASARERPQPAAAVPRPASAQRARDGGVKVRIGRIQVDVRAPAPQAAAPAILHPAPQAAPALQAAAPGAEFSAYRHYLRSGA